MAIREILIGGLGSEDDVADYGREDDSKHYHEDVVVQPELEEGDQELMRGEGYGRGLRSGARLSRLSSSFDRQRSSLENGIFHSVYAFFYAAAVFICCCSSSPPDTGSGSISTTDIC